MIRPVDSRLSRERPVQIVSFAIFTMCATNGAYPGLAQSAQPTFQSTAEASQCLFQAVQSNNGEATSSRDEAQDKVEREFLVKRYQELHRLGRDADGSVTA